MKQEQDTSPDRANKTVPGRKQFARSLASALGMIALLAGADTLVANELRGMEILLMTEPFNPPLVRQRVTEGFAGAVAVSGNYAFVGNEVLDVSDPGNPRRVGSHPWGGFDGAVVSGQYPYLLSEWEPGDGDASEIILRILDISDPAHPQQVHEEAFNGRAGGLAVSGNFLYVGVRGEGLRVFDISNPANPVFTTIGITGWDIRDVELSGNYAYVATGLRNGLAILEITPEHFPSLIAEFHSDTDGDAEAIGVSVCGDYAYLLTDVDHDATILRVFDISDPAHLRELSRYEDATGGARGLAQSGGYVYLTSDDYGLRVIDVNDPEHPRAVGGNPAFPLFDAVVAGGQVFAGAGEYGVAVFNLFKPTRLETLGARDGTFRLRLHGPRGVSYRLQRSTHLPHWEDWQRVTFGAGPSEVADPEMTGSPFRFYRLALP